jgi:hypothetical protein
MDTRLLNAPVIANNDDGMFGIELDVGQLGLFLWSNHLLTDGLILVHIQIEYMALEDRKAH